MFLLLARQVMCERELLWNYAINFKSSPEKFQSNVESVKSFSCEIVIWRFTFSTTTRRKALLVCYVHEWPLYKGFLNNTSKSLLKLFFKIFFVSHSQLIFNKINHFIRYHILNIYCQVIFISSPTIINKRTSWFLKTFWMMCQVNFSVDSIRRLSRYRCEKHFIFQSTMVRPEILKAFTDYETHFPLPLL